MNFHQRWFKTAIHSLRRPNDKKRSADIINVIWRISQFCDSCTI